jgi:hypothetical protein
MTKALHRKRRCLGKCLGTQKKSVQAIFRQKKKRMSNYKKNLNLSSVKEWWYRISAHE